MFSASFCCCITVTACYLLTMTLKIALFNLHRLNNRISILQSLCEDCDIICSKEHWLLPANIDTLYQF